MGLVGAGLTRGKFKTHFTLGLSPRRCRHSAAPRVCNSGTRTLYMTCSTIMYDIYYCTFPYITLFRTASLARSLRHTPHTHCHAPRAPSSQHSPNRRTLFRPGMRLGSTYLLTPFRHFPASPRPRFALAPLVCRLASPTPPYPCPYTDADSTGSASRPVPPTAPSRSGAVTSRVSLTWLVRVRRSPRHTRGRCGN